MRTSGQHKPDQPGCEKRDPDAIEGQPKNRWATWIAASLAANIAGVIKNKFLPVWVVFHLTNSKQRESEANENDRLSGCRDSSDGDCNASDRQRDMPMTGIPDLLKVHATHISRSEDGGTIVHLREGVSYVPIIRQEQAAFKLGDRVFVAGTVVGQSRFDDRDEMFLVRTSGDLEHWVLEDCMTPYRNPN